MIYFIGFLFCYKPKVDYICFHKIRYIMGTKKEVIRPNIALYADRVMVKVLKPEELKTASGLIMPESAMSENKTEQGRVLRVSSRITADESEYDKINEGDIILFSSFAGSEVMYKAETFKILRFTDIFGRVEQ